MLFIESALILLILVLAFTVPEVGSSVFSAIEHKLAGLAKRCNLAVVVVGATALALYQVAKFALASGGVNNLGT